MKKNIAIELENIAKEATKQESMSVAEHYEELLYELLDKLKEVHPSTFLRYYKNPDYKLRLELVISEGYQGTLVKASIVSEPARFSPISPKTLASVEKGYDSIIAKKTSMKQTDFRTLYNDVDGIEPIGEPVLKMDDPYKGKAWINYLYMDFAIDV
ncbi:MAG: hypothetical protein J6J36_05630 [Clostridia bacterium]|nr:hypothetical protein [Clostridia bacterium]